MEEVLSKARALEKQYKWLEATDQYWQVLGAVDDTDFMRKGQLHERMGLCLHRAAFQAESQEEFRARIGRAIMAYHEARESYGELPDEQGKPRVLRCSSIVKYLEHWTTRNPSEKRRLLDECLELQRNALAVLLDLGEKLEYGETYSGLSLVFRLRLFLESDGSVAKKILEGGVAMGRRAVEVLSELGDQLGCARAEYVLADCLQFLTSLISVSDGKEQLRIEFQEHSTKAYSVLEGTGDAYLLGLSLVQQVGGASQLDRSREEKAIELGDLSGDVFLKAHALDVTVYSTSWSALAAEDPDEAKRLWSQVRELYDKARSLQSIISLMGVRSGLIRAPSGSAEIEFNVAMLETDLQKKRVLLKNSEESGQEALRTAEESGVLDAIMSANHVLSKVLAERAVLTEDIDEKRRVLQKALELRQTSIGQLLERWPFVYQNLGVYYSYLAEIKAGLADLELNSEERKRLLKEAVLSLEDGLNAADVAAQQQERRGQVMAVTSILKHQHRYGILQNKLFKETHDQDHLRKAIEVWQKAIESSKKLDSVVRLGDSHWKIAQNQDALREHSQAAESFQHASESYTRAAEKIPQLRDFYQDHACYMQAWSEIEKAKQYHGEKDYRTAMEHYTKAAELHQSTKRWSYLWSNYLAWAKLEHAEDQSRREQTENARDAFELAADLFTDAEKDLTSKLAETPAGEERENTRELATASSQRREYCLSRALVEDARVSAAQGSSAVSARKYAAAAERFQKLMENMEQESERTELRPIASLCRAWGRMMQAEDRSSPTLYGEASELFEQVVKDAVDSQTSLLAQANSYMCKALEAGTRFEATRDPEQFSGAKKHLEAASAQYLRAGFITESEYPKAASRLLDAYHYMYQAQVETDLAKRARSYQIAETMLQTSAGSYLKGRHPGKAEQVQRVLESVREERQIAHSLSELLQTPAIASATTGFMAPSQSHEQAVGLERFENADIQASLMPRDQEAKLGDTIRLKIDLVNAGRGGAQLIKVAELLPEDFEVVEKPNVYPVEDRGLNLKGKSLAPLRTEELSLVLRPRDKGTYRINPRILYLDESGKYKSHEPEPATITVKELGISGWLRGPTRDK